MDEKACSPAEILSRCLLDCSLVLVLVPPRGASRVKTIKEGATEPITLAQDKLHPLQHQTNNSN